MKKLLIPTLWLTTLVAGPLASLAQGCPRPVDWWPFGPSLAVAVSGEFAFAGSGAVLEVARIADADAPAKVADLPMDGIVWDIAVQGRYAYVAAAFGGLVIVDVANPEHPFVTGRLGTEGSALRVLVRGPRAYVATAWGGVRILDVEDPGNPREIGSLDLADARGLAFAGDRLYVANGYEGLSVFDLSGAPVLLGSAMLTPEGAEAWDVAPLPSGLVAVSGSDGVEIFDVADPSAMVSVGSHPLGGWSLEIAGSFAYVAAGWGSLQVLDLSDPGSPVHVGGLEPPGDAWGLALADGLAYVANGEMGVLIADLADPAAPRELRSLGRPGSTWEAAIANRRLFVADGWAGLRVFDVAEADHLLPVTSLDLGSYTYSIAVSGSRAYLAADWDGGLQIVDISSPAEPAVVGELRDGAVGSAVGVAVSGDLAFVGSGGDGLFVVDISEPASPSLLGQLDFGAAGWVSSLAVDGDLVYVAAGPLGLRIVDVSDPTQPIVLSGVATDDFVSDVTIDGDHAFVAEGGNGMKVVDVSDPGSPIVLATVGEVGDVWGIEVDSTFAYLASTWAGLVILDISTPEQPEFAGWSPMPGTAVDLAVDGGRVFVMGAEAGVILFDTFACGGGLQADFTFFPDAPREGQAVSFVDLSLGEPEAWTWDFGDGTALSHESDPTHVFTSPGDYVVELTVATADGAVSDSTSRTVHVRERIVLGCNADDDTLCLNQERFSIEVAWTDPRGNTGIGHALSLTDDTGYFWFFDDANIELVVKVLDGTGLNGSYWLFYGALSNVAFELTATDTQTGASQVYSNPQGQFASLSDTSAFPELPSLPLWSTTTALRSVDGSYVLDDGAFPILSSGLGAAAVAADFTWSPSNPSTGQSVSFTDRSSGGPDTWCWTFGDEAPGAGPCTSTSPNPTHVYSSSGSFTVTSSISSSSGSTGDSDTATKTITVTDSGQACNLVVSPKSQLVDASGGGATITLTVESACGWSVSSNRSWVALDPPTSGQGSGSLSYTVDANTGGSRSATISIDGDGFGDTVRVNQQGGSTSGESCQPNATTLCLRDDRFEVVVEWEDHQGETGDGRASSLTSDTGTFWFFQDTNIELIVKVLDGTPINGMYWVFYGALTDVEFELTVTDKETGQTKTYFNPMSTQASVGDTGALPGDS